MSGSRGFWVAVVGGVVGLVAARLWLGDQFTQAVTAATTPDKNPIWDESHDWSQSTIEFDSESVVNTYNLSGE